MFPPCSEVFPDGGGNPLTGTPPRSDKSRQFAQMLRSPLNLRHGFFICQLSNSFRLPRMEIFYGDYLIKVKVKRSQLSIK